MVEETQRGNLVGCLVGRILKRAHPLVIMLYDDGNHHYHTRTTECTTEDDEWDALITTIDTFAPAIECVWKNDMVTPWYYIQFSAGLSPSALFLFSVPWSSLAGWQVLVMTSGRVGLV